MLSDTISKSDYIVSILQRDVNNIFNAQLLIATQNVYVEGKSLKTKVRRGQTLADKDDGDKLVKALQEKKFTISQRGSNFTLSVDIVKKVRFRDMKKFGNWKIYNRQVWGILYNNALRDIRDNYGSELSNNIGDVLREAFEKTETKKINK